MQYYVGYRVRGEFKGCKLKTGVQRMLQLQGFKKKSERILHPSNPRKPLTHLPGSLHHTTPLGTTATCLCHHIARPNRHAHGVISEKTHKSTNRTSSYGHYWINHREEIRM
ncbi:hypothetical protein DQ04_14881020 [Trypanosoma grayi]|uniref:hypothetical protein n=1 Tax=Trypanosoma grayi TaxID=71804 RepID=UPI0004F3F6CB|nr:hypothetical protein DQ04_14881020 [Trypanosoma grayi]KEG06274.1 hypothetical protein DQ04_14881020 [Trypanosoma grayi]